MQSKVQVEQLDTDAELSVTERALALVELAHSASQPSLRRSPLIEAGLELAPDLFHAEQFPAVAGSGSGQIARYGAVEAQLALVVAQIQRGAQDPVARAHAPRGRARLQRDTYSP